MSKVVLGLSGGVDSAACAVLLRQAGHEVYAVYLNNSDDESSLLRAQRTACALSLPFKAIDVRAGFRKNVIEPFMDAYLRGETPNPCVDCNKLVKFAELFRCADETGCDFVATGHYARVEDGSIWRSRSINDQSYMLWQLHSEWIPRLIFPLGDFATKDDVRAVASDAIPAFDPKPSMDICFIPSGDHSAFISANRPAPPPGDFIDEQGNILGRHSGIHHYTVGMRRHLGIALGQRMYVKKIDPQNNTVTLAPVSDACVSHVTACDINFFPAAADLLVPGSEFNARVRHSRRMGKARLLCIEPQLRAEFAADPSCGTPAPGQSIVIYSGDRLLGGGKISNVHEML